MSHRQQLSRDVECASVVQWQPFFVVYTQKATQKYLAERPKVTEKWVNRAGPVDEAVNS